MFSELGNKDDKLKYYRIFSSVMTMRASLRLVVLLLVALHLKSFSTKYYLVETDGKAASVHRNHKENTKHLSSSKTSKAKTGSVKRKGKKTRARDRNKALTKPGKYQFKHSHNLLILYSSNHALFQSYTLLILHFLTWLEISRTWFILKAQSSQST